MNARSGPPLSFAEAFDLPLSVDLRTAARAFGVCPGTAYRLIRLGTFPCPVLRVGGRYRIPTAQLLRSLGIEERPVYAADLETGAAYADRFDDTRPYEVEHFA
ncbi:helix-turn-helix domain-containing protein [Streptomyces sp. CAU 1734]|uniref:helix-turn-helix domain-containing protein n=1 Tax=Streptomyces sp. CAU 1734 TaxID=3140360 RepID=UPI003260104B